jgi:hydrogenase-1 operon protein HyaE
MPSPLIDALTTRHGFATVNENNVDAFLNAGEQCVLFFAGDPERLVESDDVAVILPELLKKFPKLIPALVEKPAERALQLRYRFNAFPALVFLRGCSYLGAVSRLLGWQEYLTEIADILARVPSEPPPYKFPERCVPQNSPAQDHHAGELQ